MRLSMANVGGQGATIVASSILAWHSFVDLLTDFMRQYLSNQDLSVSGFYHDAELNARRN